MRTVYDLRNLISSSYKSRPNCKLPQAASLYKMTRSCSSANSAQRIRLKGGRYGKRATSRQRLISKAHENGGTSATAHESGRRRLVCTLGTYHQLFSLQEPLYIPLWYMSTYFSSNSPIQKTGSLLMEQSSSSRLVGSNARGSVHIAVNASAVRNVRK